MKIIAANGFPSTRLSLLVQGLNESLGSWPRRTSRSASCLAAPLYRQVLPLTLEQHIRIILVQSVCVCVPVSVFIININNIDGNNKDASKRDAVCVNIIWRG